MGRQKENVEVLEANLVKLPKEGPPLAVPVETESVSEPAKTGKKKFKLKLKKKEKKEDKSKKSEKSEKDKKVEEHSALPALPEDKKEVVTYDPLQQYLKEISKYPLLSREEEEKLTKEYYKTKDPRIAYRLVTSNLRLVVKIALDFQKFWMQNFLDLIQEGNVGLMQAVKKFDPYRGVKFSYYASFWIKAYILKFIMDNWRLVKIGTTQAQRKLFYNLRKEKERLDAMGFEPKAKLISERLNVREEDVIEMEQRLNAGEISLDAPIKDDSDELHRDFLADPNAKVEDQVAKKEVISKLRAILEEFGKDLKDKERVIFYERLLAEDPLTLQQIGDRFGISRERVRQIEERLLKKLRKYLKERLPDAENYPLAIEGS
ncbi:sigma-70 family RNA polymerase sigma factor [Thermodesulfatator atlanticus]|uniref:sigma-70 family RNA polymerase sigma factor n=1 Tax=Thermodesulfatator atlanticus TaxID=501497 RepID=UPI0003B724D0|nr:RNA polymerase factor sigma-32 [Thermodesulfatator atlanticus]